MSNLSVICASVFAITILLTGTITPTLLIQEADAIKSQGTFRSQINSNAVCGDTLCSAGTTPTSPTGVTMQSDQRTPDVELLFVQSSTSGTFDDGEQILTLVNVSPATVYFSDRPNRVTGFEDTEQFIGMWSEGEDSFASDPPNAVLEMHGSDGQSDVFILELFNPIYDAKDETLQYTIKILAEASDGLTHYNDRSDSKIPATFEDAVLFIDSFNLGKEMKKIFIDEPQQGDERPATILPDLPIPTPWHIVNKGGDAIGGVAQHEYNKILQSIDVGNWEEHAVKYSIKMRMLSAHAGGEFGEKIGGERGKQIGSRAGAAIGQAMAATITKTLSSGKIDNNSVIDNMDLADLTTNLKNVVSNTANNFLIAYTLTDNIIEAEGQNISDSFLTSMDKLGQESALAAAYDADNFCGGSSNDEFFENVLSKVFLHYLRLTIEAWILDDLNNGMTYDQIQADLDENMEDTVRLVILYTFWGLQDICLIDSDNDMYSLIFNQLFIVDTTPDIPDPSIGGEMIITYWDFDVSDLTNDGTLSSNAYPAHYADLPNLVEYDLWPEVTIEQLNGEYIATVNAEFDVYYIYDADDLDGGSQIRNPQIIIEEEPLESSGTISTLDNVALKTSDEILAEFNNFIGTIKADYELFLIENARYTSPEMQADLMTNVAEDLEETLAKDVLE